MPRRPNPTVFLLVMFLGLAPVLSACGQAQRVDDNRLIQAGFVKVADPGPALQAAMKSLPPNRFARRTVDGKKVVLYSDPIFCNCVYSGDAKTRAAFAQVMVTDTRAFDEYVSTDDYGTN